MSDKQDLCVTMVNEQLLSVPRHSGSSDVHIKWYAPGDDEIWVRLQSAADLHNTITKELFVGQFPHGTFDLKHRQCYLYDRAGRALATATAWAEVQGPFAGYGLVHWIAVLPEFQHRGLGKILMDVTCQRLLSLGYERACLRTSTLRPDAIALYQRFGFSIESVKSWG
jgi:GNAT superfamily N-acetyltransferase